MHIIGYILAIFIGVSLGLMGSGGSILTVPLLVYFFGVEPALATSYSLFLVGTASGVGTIVRLKQGQINLRIVALFGFSSVITVYLSRKFLLPAIPDVLLNVGHYPISKSMVLMILFSLLLFLSALFILKGPLEPKVDRVAVPSVRSLLLYGVGIGLITGFLGAGGGFLIVPVLMLLFRSPIQIATSTSLAIITVNMLLGSLGDLGRVELDWSMLGVLLVITLIGLVVGQYLSRRIDGRKLSRGFGWFLLTMSLLIFIMEMGSFFYAQY